MSEYGVRPDNTQVMFYCLKICVNDNSVREAQIVNHRLPCSIVPHQQSLIISLHVHIFRANKGQDIICWMSQIRYQTLDERSTRKLLRDVRPLSFPAAGAVVGKLALVGVSLSDPGQLLIPDLRHVTCYHDTVLHVTCSPCDNLLSQHQLQVRARS